MRGFKPREFIEVLHKNGWKEVSRTSKGKGSHTNFKHPNYEIVITIPIGHKKELSRPLITRIIKQAQITI
jgi:predicted RNA binding protein YcfA (HicA-like mRNA interferase family)